MAGHTYAIPRRYNYNDFQAQEGGYAYGQEQLVNSYVVETTVERVRVPASRYTTFGGGPLKNGNQRGDMFKYSPKDRYEGYEQVYASDVENSVPPRYHEEDNLMTNFRNKLQIGTSQPIKSNGLSSPNKHRPSSPNKYRPKSPKPYRPASPDKYLPSSLNKYQPSSPDKYPSTIPDKYRPHSPNKYRPSSPNKYRSTIPDKYRPLSPNKYRPTSPNKYHPSSPNKYRHDSPDKFGASSPIKYRSTSPDSYHHKSPNKYRPTSPNKYHPSSTNKSQVKSPSKYRPTSPTRDYPSKEALMLKAHPLPGPTKYQHASPTRYKPTGPTHIYPTKDDPVKKAQHLPVLNKYQHTDPNYRWQSEGPPPTRHPLTGPTNDINEALGFLMETVNYAPRSDPRREGAFDTLSPRARPIDHERRYARSGFGGATDQPYLKSNTINSEEAVRRSNYCTIKDTTIITPNHSQPEQKQANKYLALFQTKMAGTTYVTKGYSTYTNIPGQQGTYDHNPKHSTNQYVVESKTVERVRAPAAGYTDFHGNGSPSKVELLKEYVHPNYAPKNHHDDYEPSYGRNYENSSPPFSPDKQAHGYFSEESNRIRSGPGYVRTGNISSPLATRHPLTTPTNNMNEALGMLEESVYYSPRADPRRRGVLDDLSTRAQPHEPQRRYARPAFVAKTNDGHNYFNNREGTIDSHEAARRYRGSFMP